MATPEQIIKAGAMLRVALGVCDSGGNPRTYIKQALDTLADAPPAPPPPTPVDGYPDVVKLNAGPFEGQFMHKDGAIRKEWGGPEGMKDYVERLAAQWHGAPPTFDDWAQKVQQQPQDAPPAPTGSGETEL